MGYLKRQYDNDREEFEDWTETVERKADGHPLKTDILEHFQGCMDLGMSPRLAAHEACDAFDLLDDD